MIVFCLGLPSSASTWAYNVTRGLLVASKPETLGVFVQSASDLRCAVPPGTTELILKAHTLDETLFRLVETSQAVLILTWRDPRDAAVSMAARTGTELGGCIGDIQRSASVILSLLELEKPGTIFLDYSQDYMNRIETIHEIAGALGIRPPAQLVRRLHQSLKTTTLKKSIDDWSKSLGPETTFSSHVDMDTHWHKNHLGDGRNGKWREVTGEWEADLDAALGGYQAAFEGQTDLAVTLLWNRLSVPTRIERECADGNTAWSNGVAAEIYLPRGWWTASFDFDSNSSEDRVIECRVQCRDEMIAQRVIATAGATIPQTLTFKHTEAGSALQVRFSCLVGNAEPAFRISDIKFNRLAKLAAGSLPMTAARQVSTQVLPIG